MTSETWILLTITRKLRLILQNNWRRVVVFSSIFHSNIFLCDCFYLKKSFKVMRPLLTTVNITGSRPGQLWQSLVMGCRLRFCGCGWDGVIVWIPSWPSLPLIICSLVSDSGRMLMICERAEMTGSRNFTWKHCDHLICWNIYISGSQVSDFIIPIFITQQWNK